MQTLFHPDSKLMQGLSRLYDLALLNCVFLLTCLPVVTIGAASAARETLEEVSTQLRLLAAAVARDLQADRGFPGSARALGNAVTALGTVLKDQEGTQRLARALQGLSGDE